MSSPVSEHVSHYRLLERLGQGSMGEVWLAEDTQLPRKVAVKLLPRHMAEDADAVARLLREAQAAASVDHPGVVTVYEAGVHDGRPYLVMQRVEGETLEARLARGPLSVPDALNLGIEVADALAEVHALGIVHRDLKPANVIMSPRGARVLDFGVASVQGSPRLTTTGVTVGTPLAMAPEQLRGQPADNRTDLWALGVMLCRAVTGSAPFAGDTVEQVLHAVLNLQPQPPSAQRPGLPGELDFIIMKLLRKDVAHRYARAEDLLADLRSCAAGLSGATAVAAPSAPEAASLAVLPFELLSAEPDDAFLAAGLAEDLVVDLTRLGGLRVATRAETLAYRDRAVPPRTVARELGVDYVLIGSVRRAGNRARISTQLVRAADGHVLWAERFDRTLDDLFEVQAEVSKRIVDALQIELRPGERAMLDRAPTRSPEAYQMYLRARPLMDTGRVENMRAEELLKQALALDPDFALAMAVLGEAYARRAMRWWAGLEMADLAQPLAERALVLEPGLVEAQMVLAMVHRLRGEVLKLQEVLTRLTAIAPDHPDVAEWAAWSYMSTGQPELARVMLERLVLRHPEQYRNQSWLWQCYDQMGLQAEAGHQHLVTLECLIDAVRRQPEDVYARSLLSTQLILDGERDAGVAQAERTLEISPQDGRLRYNAACAFARAGLADRAIRELQEGVRQLPSYISDWPKRDPDLASLHERPEFIEMFGKVANNSAAKG